MTGRARIVDFDAAYSNVDVVPDAAGYPPRWRALAAAFRAQWAQRSRLDLAYGPGERHRYDLFRPEGEPLGLVVFVHGGYWRAFDKSLWSHLAAGALGRGHAVAIPSYTLCPQARIAQIGEEIGRFLEAVALEVSGPIRLAGHSAGGQIVTRLTAAGSSLAAPVRARVATVVSISGLHDLRPLLRTRLNEILRLDETEAADESPIFHAPDAHARFVCVVGQSELPEFRRQNALLADVWRGLGAEIEAVERPGRHHFDIVDGLCDPHDPLSAALTGAAPRW